LQPSAIQDNWCPFSAKVSSARSPDLRLLNFGKNVRAGLLSMNLSELRSRRWAGLDEIVIAVEALWHKVII